MKLFSRRMMMTLGLLALLGAKARATDLVALSPQTWDRYAPLGKEADAIYGDLALANDQLIAVIAQPRRGRNANMTVHGVGGCVIDLTRRDRQSDLLSAFYPGAHLRDLKFGGVEVVAPTTYEVDEIDRLFVQARRVSLRLVALPREKEPDVEVRYILEDGWPELVVDTRFTNNRATPVEFDLVDSFRLDGSFEFSAPGVSDLFWAYDKHFGQAYGLYVDDHTIQSAVSWERQLRYRDHYGKVAVRLEPGQSYRLFRMITPGANLFDVRRHIAKKRTQEPCGLWTSSFSDTGHHPVAFADVVVEQAGKRQAWGRTNEEGKIAVTLDDGPGTLTITSMGRGTKAIEIGPGALSPMSVELPVAGRVTARITDAEGGPIPCKVQFIGRNGTANPDFGPDSGEHAVKNRFTARTAASTAPGPGPIRGDRQPWPGVRRRIHVHGSRAGQGNAPRGDAHPDGEDRRLDQRRFSQPFQPLGRQHVEPAWPRAEPALRARRVRSLHRAQPAVDLRSSPEAAWEPRGSWPPASASS